MSSDNKVERRPSPERGLLNVHAKETVRSNPRNATSKSFPRSRFVNPPAKCVTRSARECQSVTSSSLCLTCSQKEEFRLKNNLDPTAVSSANQVVYAVPMVVYLDTTRFFIMRRYQGITQWNHLYAQQAHYVTLSRRHQEWYKFAFL